MQIGVATLKLREFGSFLDFKIHLKIKYYKFQQSQSLFGAEKRKLLGDIKNFKQQVGLCLLELLDFIHTTGSERTPARPPEPRPPGYYYSFVPKLKIASGHDKLVHYQRSKLSAN